MATDAFYADNPVMERWPLRVVIGTQQSDSCHPAAASRHTAPICVGNLHEIDRSATARVVLSDTQPHARVGDTDILRRSHN